MKTLLYANRAEPKSISVISILLLAAAGDITKLRCMHRECYICLAKSLELQKNYFYKCEHHYYNKFRINIIIESKENIYIEIETNKFNLIKY